MKQGYKRNSLEYTPSPSMMQQQQQQPCYPMPHTPIQAPRSVAPASASATVHNSGGTETALNTSTSSYMAPHSVPTPSRYPPVPPDPIDYSQQMSVGGGGGLGSAPGSNLNVSYESTVAPPKSVAMTRSLSSSAARGATAMAAAPPKPSAGASMAVQRRPTTAVQPARAMSKMAAFVLHFPLPLAPVFQHERNQRFVVLYGFGANK